VAVYVDPPFVIKANDGYGGFAIELSKKIASAEGWKNQGGARFFTEGEV